MGSILYLLHFDEPYPNGNRPRHYLGATVDLESRIQDHRRGRGRSRLTSAIHQAGIGFELARVWEFSDRHEAFQTEARLKKQRHHARLCPICNPKLKP